MYVKMMSWQKNITRKYDTNKTFLCRNDSQKEGVIKTFYSKKFILLFKSLHLKTIVDILDALKASH